MRHLVSTSRRRLSLSVGAIGVMVLIGAGCVDGASANEDAPCTSGQDCLAYQVCGAEGVCEGTALADVGYGADASPDASAEAILWQAWGTAGVTAPLAEAALCGVNDVRTSDLTDLYLERTPAEPWPDMAQPDIVAHCGDDYETFAWRLANCERLTRDLPPLDCDLRLVWLGRAHATDMGSHDYFAHVDPAGHDVADRLAESGIHFAYAGENLASFSSVEAAHVEWMDSPTHRANILGEHFDTGGVGVVRVDERYMLTSVFLTQ